MRRRLAAALAVITAVVALALPSSAAPAACGSGLVAYVGYDSQETLRVTPIDGGRDETLDRGNGGLALSRALTSPSFSPDGRRVAWAAASYSALWAYERTELYVMDLRTSRRTTVLSVPVAGGIYDVRWSPDGRRIAFVLWTPNYATFPLWLFLPLNSGIFVVNPDGSRLTAVAPVGHVWNDHDPRWSPDGKQLAFTSWREGVPALFVTRDLVTARRVTPIGISATLSTWAPDGRALAFVGTDLKRVAGEPLADHSRLWTVRADGSGARDLRVATFDTPDWSPDGRLIAFSGPGIAVVRPDGRGFRRLAWDRADLAPRWTPDGTRLVFARYSGGDPYGDGGHRLWVMRRDGTGARQVTEGRAFAWTLTVCGRR